MCVSPSPKGIHDQVAGSGNNLCWQTWRFGLTVRLCFSWFNVHVPPVTCIGRPAFVVGALWQVSWQFSYSPSSFWSIPEWVELDNLIVFVCALCHVPYAREHRVLNHLHMKHWSPTQNTNGKYIITQIYILSFCTCTLVVSSCDTDSVNIIIMIFLFRLFNIFFIQVCWT